MSQMKDYEDEFGVNQEERRSLIIGVSDITTWDILHDRKLEEYQRHARRYWHCTQIPLVLGQNHYVT